MMRLIRHGCTLVLLGASYCSGFISNYPPKQLIVFSTSTTREPASRTTSLLEAKKGNKSKKKKKASAAVGGGFGEAPSKPKPKVNGDYSVFPRLEPELIETLDPSPDDWAEEADQLPQEIYDRLNQIYGLKNFNYDKIDTEQQQEEDSTTLSLAELMSATDSETSSSGSTSTSNDDSSYLFGEKPASTSTLDLDDLLASATGGSVSTKVSSPTEVSSSPAVAKQELCINNLPNFKEFRILHIDPLVLAVDDFFTEEECDKYVTKSSKNDVMQTTSPTVGKDSNAKAQRTSTTYYHHFENVPELMAKASRLLGLDGIERWEEPQTVRYRKSEKFTWHLDALGPNENKPELGGQRLATLLVYLTDLDPDEGGATMFRDLGKDDGDPLKVRPKKGSALLFFPAAGGVPNAPFDVRTLHCGQAVSEEARHDKWISQLWLRQSTYTPTAPPDNSHAKASDAIATYCTSS